MNATQTQNFLPAAVAAIVNAAAAINDERNGLKLPTIDVERIGQAVMSEETTAKAAEEAKAVQKANKATFSAAFATIAKDEAGNFRDLGLVLEIMYIPRTKQRLNKMLRIMKEQELSYKDAYIATRQDEADKVAGNETRAYMAVAKARTTAMKKEADAAKKELEQEEQLEEKKEIAAREEALQQQQAAILQRAEQLEQEKQEAVSAVQRELNDVKIASDARISELLQQVALLNKAVAEKQAEVVDLQGKNAALEAELSEVKHELHQATAAGKAAGRAGKKQAVAA